MKNQKSEEIRFKAWDKEQKKMFDFVEIRYGMSGMPYFRLGQSYCYDEDGYEEFGIDWEDKDYLLREIEFLRPTGLEDKNGKKIYEEDIIKTSKGCIWRITFMDGVFRLDNKFLFSMEAENFEVIGSVYKNPELLKNYD